MKSMIATVRYDTVVMWERPGDTHYVTFLKKGDTVEILVGWKYSERTWKDKRYLKVLAKHKIGYVLAESLTTSYVNTKPFDYRNGLWEESESSVHDS